MPTILKIKIKDDPNIRCEIDTLYEKTKQKDVANWAIIVARHVLELANADDELLKIVESEIKVNHLWQENKATVYDVRKASLGLHRLARESENEITKTALRAIGHAVASGHVKEHAMVASDYAIKTINQITSNDMVASIAERRWQLEEINKFVQK